MGIGIHDLLQAAAFPVQLASTVRGPPELHPA